MTPALTIIIPVYNTAKYIADCLSSIFNYQKEHVFFEVIIIDDGSTDNSADIISSFCASYSNLHYYYQENQGVSVARMNGVSHAQGDYIWFVDSDDYLIPNALEVLIKTMGSNPSTDVFVAPMHLTFEDGREEFDTQHLDKEYDTIGKDLLMENNLFSIGPPQFIVKRSLFEYNWLYFPTGVRFEDEYYSRILKYHATHFHVLKQSLYVYRQWNGSHMNSISMSDATDVITIYQHLDRFANEEVSSEDQSCFRYNIVSFLLECYTRFLSHTGTQEFSRFKKQYQNYIFAEWWKYHKYFPFKDNCLAILLQSTPRGYSKLLTAFFHLKRKIINRNA